MKTETNPLYVQTRLKEDAIVEFVKKNPNSTVMAVRDQICPEYRYAGVYTMVRRLIRSGELGATRAGHIMLLYATVEAGE